MALSEQEKQIVLWGKNNGKSLQEVQQAVAKYRQSNFAAPAPQEKKPTVTDRLAEVGLNAANRIKEDISGTGNAQGQSSIRRGVDATATGFNTVLAGANAFLPNSIQDLEKKANPVIADTAEKIVGKFAEQADKIPLGTGSSVGDAVGIFGKLSKLLGSQAAQDFVTTHPQAAKALEETLATTAGIGEIAGTIAGAEGVGAGSTKAVSGANKALDAAAAKFDTSATNIAGTGTKKIEDALTLTAPTLGKKQTISAFENAGKPGGVATERGFMGRIKYEPTQFDREVAQEAMPYISKSKNAAQNNYALGKEIERFSQDEITPFLEANPRAINVKTVEKRLRDIPVPDLFKTDPILARTYALVRQKMVNRIAESEGNSLGLWNARKKFDQDVIKEFGDIAFDDTKAVPIRRAIQDMRREVNTLIGDQIGDDTFKNQLSRLNRLYEAQGRIAESNYKVLGSSKFKRWAEQNPEKANLIKYAVPAGLSTLGVGSLLSN